MNSRKPRARAARFNLLTLIGVSLIAVAALALPVYSVRSSSPAASGANDSTAEFSSLINLRARRAGIGPFAAVPSSSPETIEILDSSCSNPKTAFVLGEAVCARVTFVTETNRFVNWFGPSGHAYGGAGTTPIPDNQPHDYLYTPTEAGLWKASIADPSDSSIIPAEFTVEAQSGIIQTYAPGCIIPKVSFNLGETVCAKITGAAQPANGRPSTRVGWVSPYGSVAQGGNITSDPQQATYAIPATATQTFTDIGGGTTTIDNRGVWRLGVYSALDGSLIETVPFTVHDPTKQFVDLAVYQSVGIFQSSPGAGSGSLFNVFVTNHGPDIAHDVVLSDTVPTNTTFTSMVETTGYGFTCGTPSSGVFTCTVASFPKGATAAFTFAYDVNGGTSEGTIITNNATVTSSATPCSPDATCELQSDDNSSSATATVPVSVGAETCTIVCRENFSVIANTTQSGNPGRFVTFSAGSVYGNCGAITTNPVSGSFFGMGSTVVNVVSDTGGGSCSFTITVVEGTPPTISCPPDKTATADSPGGTHTFTAAQIGLPTSNPADLPVTFVRSDDTPATYDSNGNVDDPAVVHAIDAPYPTGTTGITWTVTDANGLTASCTQRIVVHEPCATDTASPTITAPADITRATGPNSTTCGVVLHADERGQPDAQDDCAYTLSISGVPAGDLFPIGTTTITYTATDGAGHTASDTQLIIVTDNTPPVIFAPANASYTCPENVPTLSTSQAFGPDVDGNPDPSKPVFDNCGRTVTASQTISGSGSGASPRVITRTYTAVDTSGNSSSAVQIITVTDSTPPTITAPPDVTAYTGLGATTCDAVVSNATLGTPSATDNCAGVTVSRSPSGNTFPVGTTTVTWTATDWAGNTATATQTVTVIDNTVPVITVIASTPSMWPPNHKYQTFQLTGFVTGASDNCGGVSVSNVVIEKVTSDETENGNGDGNTSDDIVIAANCKSVQLRSERDGGGNGRVYTITFKVTDTHGNVGRATSKVVVPHNNGGTPIDSGVHYTENGTCP